MWLMMQVSKSSKDKKRRHAALSGKAGSWIIMNKYDEPEDLWSGNLVIFEE
jgi:hypothetical protein